MATDSKIHDAERGMGSSSDFEHKEHDVPLEVIRTVSRVPGNPNYHMKNGLRLEGDGYDHDGEFKLSFKVLMALVGCSLAFAGSQMIPLFYFTLYTTIARDLGAASFVWLSAAGTIGQVAASVTLGPLSDLLGRKSVFIGGISLSMIGMILCAATPNPTGFIAGQAIAGYGLIVEELLSIAVTSELVPTAKRPLYGAAMILGFIPWTPGSLYAQLMTNRSWRWIGCLIAIWNLITLVIIVVFYHPPPRVNSKGLSRPEVIKRIDFVGMALGLAGLVIFLIGLFWGGTFYPWSSTHVAATLGVGLGLMVLFVIYEKFVAPYPVFPSRLIQAPRTFWPLMIVICAAGVNYVPLAIFWPIQSISVFDSDHTQTGINTVPVGICILGGAVLSAAFIGLFKKRVRLIMTFFCIVQTAGIGSMAAIDPHKIKTAWAPFVLALIGVGGVLFPNQLVVTIITPDDLLATVTSLTFVVRGVSQVVGLAILQNRFVHQVTKYGTSIVGPAAIGAGIYSIQAITDLVTSLTAVPFKQYVPIVLGQYVNTPAKYAALQEATVEAFGKSFPILYYIGLAFGAVACIASALMGDVAQYMDEHVAVILD